MEHKVPFKTPVDYWVEALSRNPDNIEKFHEIQKKTPKWTKFDNDLHIYPFTHAVPAMISMGCNNKCNFCPTYKEHKGKITHARAENIIPHYEGKNVHFMDENFFRNDMDKILPLLKKYNVTWLAMSDAREVKKVLSEYGEKALFDSGLRVIEVGLEHIDLYRKVPLEGIGTNLIEICYLNMCFLPGENKKTLVSNGRWMKNRGLKRPIHYNNGTYEGLGQFYMNYGPKKSDGIELDPPFGRTMPTYVPDSFLQEDFKIIDLEKTNYNSQMVYDFKQLPEKSKYNVREFIGDDYKKAIWVAQGIRLETIK